LHLDPNGFIGRLFASECEEEYQNKIQEFFSVEVGLLAHGVLALGSEIY